MVVDVINFFNELEILEIRLNTLDPVVDKFIITESTKTHSGQPKPFYFFDNLERFSKFKDKIVWNPSFDTPDDYTNLSNDTPVNQKVNQGDWWPHNVPSYGRDTYEKEFNLMGMVAAGCKPDDIIMFSDADEIPNPDTVNKILKDFNANEIYNLKQRMYFYYFNILKEDNWVGNTILTFENYLKHSFCELRVRRRGIFVDDGGWHFSFMGGLDRIRTKIESYGEQSLNTADVKDSLQNRVANCLTNGVDLFNRPCRFWKVFIDESYPEYLVENLEKFKDYVY